MDRRLARCISAPREAQCPLGVPNFCGKTHRTELISPLQGSTKIIAQGRTCSELARVERIRGLGLVRNGEGSFRSDSYALVMDGNPKMKAIDRARRDLYW
jgi:hypothetical protein